MQKVAFLYLNYTHHVYHSAPIAFTLSQYWPQIQVDLITSHSACGELLEELARLYPDQNCNTQFLKAPFLYLLSHGADRAFPRISVILKTYREFIDGYDAIVATDFDAIKLKTHYGVNNPKYILTSHGAGDRAYGYNPLIKHYDYVLLSGQKRKQRLEKSGLITSSNSSVVIGYSKFDLLSKLPSSDKRLFPENRRTVLYNPHFDPDFSSWHKWGMNILEYFYHSDQFNLIFSPHIMLFHKRKSRDSLIKFATADNIHIDYGSAASIDMSYTQKADIYLGDVSSQVYEFLINPRPCVFLNTHKIDWQVDDNYYHWQLGPVVERIEDLDKSMEQAEQTHQEFLPTQRRLFKETFDLNDEPSAHRGARAIASFID